MRSKYSVKLKTIVADHNLRPIHLAKDYEEAVLTTADVNRPAMQLTGFYNYFDPRRMQIIGRVESTYLNTLSREERRRAYERFMGYDIAALVVCHGVTPSPECVEMAERFDRNLFVTDEDTSDFQANVIASLHNYLAPRLTTHGVLVEIYGEGVLLMGDSGIGKSETALELIKRGHRLVADPPWSSSSAATVWWRTTRWRSRRSPGTTWWAPPRRSSAITWSCGASASSTCATSTAWAP